MVSMSGREVGRAIHVHCLTVIWDDGVGDDGGGGERHHQNSQSNYC